MDDHVEPIDSPMQRCVDRDDLDGLLALVSTDEIALAWHRYTDTPEPKDVDHPDWWAVELFMARAIYQRTDLHRTLLLALVDHASDDTLGNVAAGPLEDFVSDDEDDLRWIETECTTNLRLRTALTGMWSATHVSEATMLRLDAAAGEPLPRPRPRSEWPPELIARDDAERRLYELVPGGMTGYRKIEHPTDEQRAAVAALKSAEQALMDLVRELSGLPATAWADGSLIRAEASTRLEHPDRAPSSRQPPA